MLDQNNNYSLLIGKLDQFTRKYYINQIIRGFLFSIALILLLFLAVSVLESEFYFSRGVRKAFFFSFIGITSVALIYWIVRPALQYFRLGKTISHEQAAGIIGEHFADVEDKLLNILQLKKQTGEASDTSLIFASINQKAEKLKLVPFKSAIDLGKNKKYMRYALPPFLMLLVLLFAAPSLIKDGTHRIINNNKDFERAAPFHFKVKNDVLNVVQYEDFTLDVKVDGETLPSEVFINVDDYQYRLNKKSNNTFSYTFKNVQKSHEFRLFSGKVESESNTLEVLPKPNMVDFSMRMIYPSYLNRTNETLDNIGDAIVPVGTRIKWEFNTLNTESVAIKFSNKEETTDLEKSSADQYSYSKGIYSDQSYNLYLSNQYIPLGDSLAYNLSVIPDQHPSINVQQFQDSLEESIVYFVGNASDDYGLTRLQFNYTITDEDGRQQAPVSKTIKNNLDREIQYDHLFDIEELGLEAGQSVTYYFEVFDNDAVNGSKSAKTGALVYSKASLEELEEKEEENEEEIKDDLKESIDEAKKIQEELKKMRDKLLQEKEMDWKDKKELEKLMERQEELQKKFEDAKEKFEENLQNEKNKERNEELLQKQEKLQEMFENVLNDETKELMEKISELMQEMQKEQAMDMLEKMEMEDINLEKDMDRLLELYKQLEVEKDIQDAIEKLEELAEKQEELSEETAKEETPSEESKKEQEELNEEFEELKEDMEKLEEKNEELEFPKELGEDNEEQMDDIQEDMENSSEQMEQKDSKKASESQKSAAEKMKKMAGKMQQSSQAGEMEQMEEDMQALRQLLENIVDLSFDQETLINSFTRTSINTPRYVDLVREQFKIKNDFKMVEDSLQELSKRVTQIESFVTEKVTEVNFNVDASLKNLEERQKATASQHQRYSMTNLNDLALMLSEAMQQMQQQMSGMMAGDQMCNNPGQNKSGKKGKGGRQPLDKITEGQGELSKQLKEMMKKGKKGGEGGSSEEFAKAAARQAALRKALEEAQQQREEEGQGISKELKEAIEQMDKNEIDLVNKRLNNEMLKRQQDIMTRLLKAEKAQREREYDNKRKAEVAVNKKRELPPQLEEYLKKRELEIEMYKTISPSIKPYYKYLIDNYFKELKESR